MNAGNMEGKIIDSAIACIERRGLQATTVRAIAEEAGVNISAINYYFRSKEQLIERVMEVTLNNAFDWSHFGPGEGVPAQQRLADILDHITKGALDYPELTRAHFYEPLILGRCSAKLDSHFTAFLEHIHEDLRGRGVTLGEGALRSAIVHAIAAMFGVILLAPLFRSFSRQHFHDPQERRQALEALARSVLGE